MVTQSYYRFITFTTYEDEDVQVFREDEWKSGNMSVPEDYADFIWHFARDHDEAVKNHEHKLDVMNAILNSGLGEQETY